MAHPTCDPSGLMGRNGRVFKRGDRASNRIVSFMEKVREWVSVLCEVDLHKSFFGLLEVSG